MLADRNGEFTQLILDSNALLTEVQERRELIDSILTNTQELARQLSGLVADNREALTPALQQLSTVTDILSRNRAALAQTVNNLAPFVRVFTNTLGNGRWFDSFVNDLVPTIIGAGDLHRRRSTPATGCTPTRRGQRMSGTLQRGVASPPRSCSWPRSGGRSSGRPASTGSPRTSPGPSGSTRLRRPDPRHPGRHDHRGHVPGRPGARRDAHRRRLRHPGRRRRRRPRAVPGVRPLRAVRPGLRRRADDGGRRRGAAGADGDPGRARPGLRRPRRAVRRARPTAPTGTARCPT